MPRPLPLILAPVLALVIWLGAQAAEAQQALRFDVLFRGVVVAEITLVARDSGADYALAGAIRATGLAGVFARVRFGMQAEGVLAGDVPRPARYAEDVDTGRRVSMVEMRFAGGLPEILRQSPAPGPGAVPPEAAAGTVDPLSALWRIVRGGALPCDWQLQVYDGVRRSEIVLGRAQGDGPLSCEGLYRRIAGFTSEEMADRRSFPFALRYEAREGAFVLTEVAGMSLLGPIRILRRD